MRVTGMVVAVGARAGAEVVPARAQMATTLGFHIILACFGIAFPTIVLRPSSAVLAIPMTWRCCWPGDGRRSWAFWSPSVPSREPSCRSRWDCCGPGLMRTYGAVLGVPFGFEGIFFFLEAIFTGIYLYGWQRLPGWAHFWTGIPIAITGLGGAVAVMAANSWMNEPGGFTAQPRAGRGGQSVAGLFQPGDAL